MSYESLLSRARAKLPKNVDLKERFEIPKCRGHQQGNKTVISNFYQIAESLRREPAHLLKFVLKELAAPGDLKKNAAIIGTKTPATKINQKIEDYAYAFVFCPECSRPDTKLSKEGQVTILTCQACGARQPVKRNV